LKPPGTKRLKLEYDKLLSSFGFKFNLRCYMTAAMKLFFKRAPEMRAMLGAALAAGTADANQVGLCRLTVSKSFVFRV
jgi:hypothetical protein